eukprot:m.942445 g.942445  ORF g.942445 m.942445 type:complete len:377 (-) comp23838_c0_seq30:257-1387(-)
MQTSRTSTAINSSPAESARDCATATSLHTSANDSKGTGSCDTRADTSTDGIGTPTTCETMCSAVAIDTCGACWHTNPSTVPTSSTTTVASPSGVGLRGGGVREGLSCCAGHAPVDTPPSAACKSGMVWGSCCSNADVTSRSQCCCVTRAVASSTDIVVSSPPSVPSSAAVQKVLTSKHGMGGVSRGSSFFPSTGSEAGDGAKRVVFPGLVSCSSELARGKNGDPVTISPTSVLGLCLGLRSCRHKPRGVLVDGSGQGESDTATPLESADDEAPSAEHPMGKAFAVTALWPPLLRGRSKTEEMRLRWVVAEILSRNRVTWWSRIRTSSASGLFLLEETSRATAAIVSSRHFLMYSLRQEALWRVACADGSIVREFKH